VEQSSFDLHEIVRQLRSYRWLILGVTVVVLLAGAVWTARTPRIYEATATLEYDPNPTRPLGGQIQDVADPVGNFWATREFFQTQNLVIGSREIARRVVQRLGLHEDPSYIPQADDTAGETGNVEATALALLSRLTVEPVRETRLVRIHVRDAKPERAKLIADAVADSYVQKTIEDRLESTDRAKDWLEEQLTTLRGELEAAELALHSFKQEHNVLSVSMEDRQNLVASDIQTTHAKLTEVRNERIELEARLNRLKAALAKEPNSIDPSIMEEHDALNELVMDLRKSLQERKSLAVKYGSEHPVMKSLEERIETLEEQVAREKGAIISSAERDLQQARSVETGLRSAAGDAQSAGLNLNLREIEYRRLNRERDNKAKLYEIVLERLTETDLTRMLKTTHVRILDVALVPASPVSPNLVKNLGASLLLGLILGLGAAFVAGRLDQTVHSVESIESLGLSVLGVIPHLGARDQTLETDAPAGPTEVSSTSATSASFDLIVHENPMCAAAEAFRMIRTNLAFMSQGSPIRSLAVTSALPLVGKTTVATNLATSLAQFGRSVLLVDTDLRRPRVHNIFGLDNHVGVSSLVIGHASIEQAVKKTRVDGLSVLSSGPIPPNPSELLHSTAFARLKDDLTQRYDWVVFDSPPLGAVTDAAILAPQVDGVLLVVRSGRTTRQSILSDRKQLDRVSARLIGAVLNDLDVKKGRYQYGAYSYRYSSSQAEKGSADAA
jgi:succinoglycan biosynthesis transport protein ExoP